MSAYRSIYSPLTFHLAESLMSLIYTTNATIYQRTNLIAVIFSDVSAMLSGIHKEQDAIKELEQRIHKLRDNYEPILDAEDTAIPKRIAFEKKLDITRTELIKIIDRNSLVSDQTLKEVQGAKWE